MQFIRYGKAYHLKIETAADLDDILALDEALWAATSAPVSAFRCDPRVLALIDHDGSGRIASEELRAAWRWTRVRLADQRWLCEPFAALPLHAINLDTEEGRALKASADHVLRTLGQPDATTVTLQQIRRCQASLDKQPFNGDGVIVAAATKDADAATLVADAVAFTGGTTDASGERGINVAQLNAFLDAAKAWRAWNDQGAGLLETGKESPVMPLGADTPAAYQALLRVRQHVDEYFDLCRIQQYEPALLATGTSGLAGHGSKREAGMAGLKHWLATEPLARVSDDHTLPLAGPKINPLHADALEACRQLVLRPCLPELGPTLSAAAWQKATHMLRPYADYAAQEPSAITTHVPPVRLARYADPAAADRVRKLIARDTAVAGIRQGIGDLERLWLYTAHLVRLANNITSFSELYSATKRALFEHGSAVIDGRWFNLALRVTDVNAHAAVTRSSNIFTLYLEVERMSGEGTFTVALPATYGTKGNLREGKRGVFFDIDGIEHDARVVKIIEHPISVREALMMPLLKLRDFVIGKIESISGAHEKQMESNADALFKPPPPASTPGPAPTLGMGSAGALVGLGVATAALGSAFAYISNTMISMSVAQRLLSLTGALAIVFVPVSLVAILKLRSQDLSSLLEAGGWAVNVRLRLSRAQRRQFTRPAPFPAQAQGTPQRRWWPILLAIALTLLAATAWRAWTLAATDHPHVEPTSLETTPRDVE